MQVARFLRRFTRAKDEQGQHDVLKILFKHYRYGAKGRYEVKHGIYRLDIWIDETHEAIEMKTIVDVTVEKVQEKAVAVVDLRDHKGRPVDRLWIAYFYKFHDGAGLATPCKYILVLLDVDLTGAVDVAALNEDLIAMSENGKHAVAAHLGINDKLIIPVDNIMLVEEVEREIKELKRENEEKDAFIDQVEEEKDKLIEALSEKERENAELAKENAEFAKENAELKRRLGIDD